MQTKAPLLMQGFDLASVPILTVGANEFFEFEQQRGEIRGIDFLPFKSAGDDSAGQSLNVAIGGQQILKNEPIISLVPLLLICNRQLPVRVDANGGQSLQARLNNQNAVATLEGQIAVFYENQYDKSPLSFAFGMGDGLTLKRESFTFTVPANGTLTEGFTVARGYGNIGAISVIPETNSVVKIAGASNFDLSLNGVRVFQNVALNWMLAPTNRKSKIFPIDEPPSSTNEITIDNSLNPNVIQVAVTLYFNG